MAWQLTQDVGYHGVAKIGNEIILCTGGQLTLSQDPIMGTGVWGASYKNAAPVVWAYNYLKMESNLSYELTTGSGNSVWSELKKAAITDRNTPVNLMIKPNGAGGFSGSGLLTTMSFSCSEGQAVTGDVSFVCDAGANNGISTGSAGTGSNNVAGVPSFAGNPNLVAYWQTSVSGYSDVINWSVNYNSEATLLKCCTGSSTAPVGADYVVLGDITADGSFDQFGIRSAFGPSGMHQIKQNVQFKMNDKSITIPRVLLSQGSTSMQTGASYVSVSFNFQAIGDGANPLINMS